MLLYFFHRHADAHAYFKLKFLLVATIFKSLITYYDDAFTPH